MHFHNFPGNIETDVLSPGLREIEFSCSTRNLARFTLILPCGLDRSDFSVRSTRVYVNTPSGC